MNKFRKPISVIMSLIIVLSMFAGMNISSSAETLMLYDFNEDGITITEVNPYLAGNVVIPSEIDGYPVTEIGPDAFRWCVHITAVTIPDSVKRIGGGAFSTMNNPAITIGSGVVSIDDTAFEGIKVSSFSVSEDNKYFCTDEYGVLYNKEKTKLYKYPSRIENKKYDIPYGVTEIKIMAFYGNSYLEEINIPETVTTLGTEAFSSCSALEEIYIPGSIKEIDSQPFVECRELKRVEFGEGVESLGSVFRYCEKLETVIFPDSLTLMTGGTFFHCYSLSEITIPDSVTEIGAGTFIWCTGLSEVNLPERLEIIGDSAFYLCGSLYSINLPSTLKEIGDSCFAGCPLKEIEIPSLIEHLGFAAFSGTCVKTVTIPGNIETLSSSLFTGCGNLEKVIISDGVTEIWSSAFKECEKLTTFVIPESVTYISDTAIGVFEFNPREMEEFRVNGDEITIYGVPGSYAEEYAKNEKINFKNIAELPEEPEIIKGEHEGFSYELRNNEIRIVSSDKTLSGKVVIPEKIAGYPVTEIGSGAFFNNDSVTEIVIPDTVTTIDGKAIFSCENLKMIAVPESVTSIGSYALGGFYDSGQQNHVYDLVICGKPGSAAESYVDNYFYELEFEDIDNLPEEPTTKEPDPEEPETPDVPESEEVLSWDKDLYYKETDNTAVLTVNHPAGARVSSISVSNCFSYEISGNSYIFDLSVYEMQNDITVTFSDGTQAQTTLFVIKDATPVDVKLKWSYESDNSAAYLYLDMPSHVTIYSVKCDNPDITSAFYLQNVTFWLHGVTTESEVTIMLTNGQIINTTVVPEKTQKPETTTKEPVTQAPVTNRPVTEEKTTADTSSGNNSESIYLKGDVNSDKKITAADARITLRVSAKLDSTQNYNVPATVFDVNSDNKITAADARKILRVSAKLEKM